MDLTILFISKTSYEEERSQIDFDDVVRQNQEKYRGETKLTNEQVEIPGSYRAHCALQGS